MKKATIIFGSTTGNTEIVADKIAETMTGYDVQVIYVTDAKDDTAVKEADLVLYGCSTMGLGELQDDFIPYYENRMTPALLKGKNVAVFGLGDKENYEDYFCWAADILSKKVTECGANLVCPPLKVDGEPDDNEAAVVAGRRRCKPACGPLAADGFQWDKGSPPHDWACRLLTGGMPSFFLKNSIVYNRFRGNSIHCKLFCFFPQIFL